ncbi:helix-turn-helix domain-containing protein [Microbacterium invictum]|uniref:Helix-turn-helix domain-containing protein n=1 Tax=Microbacterium invictum TaxID=515415 RepID=A0ABZ0VCA3_9MICO|nr:helix-turn-helix domain-containing protein [Microbacterium invictum]WQB71001.1 helix-turn-helix domain-containing protein [Microbacterium invictum]
MADDRNVQRADARRNRQDLLAAAGQLIVERGTDFPMKDVATRAGLGVGTLYRHFRDRHDLFAALAAEAAARQNAIALTALTAPTGWDAIAQYLDGCVALYAELPWMLTMRAEYRYMRLPDDAEVDAGQEIVDRAHREGALRPDAGIVDIALAGTMLAGMTFLPEPVRTAMIPRLRDIILDGLHTNRGDLTAPTSTGLTAEELTAEELTDIARAQISASQGSPQRQHH